MNILFQNQHFVVVEKPPLVLTVPPRFADKDPRPVLGLELQQQIGVQVFPVHRLDYEVSGLVLYALNGKAHAAGNRWFEQKKIEKGYQAISENQEKEALPHRQEMQEWKSRLLRGKKRAYESPAGKPALTHASLLEVAENGNLHWLLKPVTGRAHQLRYELSRRGFPILGDVLYGAKKAWPVGIALRAMKISFPAEGGEWGLPKELQIDGLFSDEK
jgi:tRNA pseudouridine32 synthase/23S rRNA pseudouridine746 synthase